MKSLINKGKNYLLLFFIGMQVSFASSTNELISNIETTGSTLTQDVARLIGNLGIGISVIALIGYIIGLSINAERMKEHFKSILTVILCGGLIKAISAMSIGTIF